MPWPLIVAGGVALASAGINYLASGRAADANQGASNQAANAALTMYSQGREDMAPWREAGANAMEQLMGSSGGYDIPEELLSAKPKLTDYQKSKHNKGGPGKTVITDQLGYDRALEDWNEKVRTQATPTEGGGGLIGEGPGEFTESPGYQWTLDQGLNAQQNALSAMGSNRSGKHIKAATEYAEGLASTEYDNFLRRWYDSLKPLQSVAGLGQTSAAQTATLGGNAAANAGNAYMSGGQSAGAGYINQANSLTGAIQGGANSLLQYNARRNLPQQLPAAGPGYGYGPGGYGQSAGYK